MTAPLSEGGAMLTECYQPSHKDVSFQSERGVLMSAPMISTAYLDAAADAAPGTEQWLRWNTANYVLDLADDALEHDGFDARRIAFAREQLHHITHVTIISHLSGVLDVLDGTYRGSIGWREELIRRLLEYAKFVRNSGHFRLAADVYWMVATSLDLAPSARMQAYHGRAWTLRQLGEYENAELVYCEMRALATDCGDVEMELEADLGRSSRSIECGNLPEAERMTREVLERAERIGLSKMVSRAYANLACIAGIRKRHAEVIEHCDAALHGPLSRVDRDICNVNTANAFRQLRMFAAATGRAQRVVDEADGEEERIAATIILYHVALDRGIDGTEYRSRLDGARMSAMLRAELYEVVARDHWLTGDELSSRRELENGLAYAEAHKINEALYRLDTALQDIEAKKTPTIFFAPNNAAPSDSIGTLKHIEYESRRNDAKRINWEEAVPVDAVTAAADWCLVRTGR